MSYKTKYYKYKHKYLELKNQIGGSLTLNDFYEKYPYSKEKIDETEIQVSFLNKKYKVKFKNDKYYITEEIGEEKKEIIEMSTFMNCQDMNLGIIYSCSNDLLLNIVLETFNLSYVYSDKQMRSDILLNGMHILLNKKHNLYCELNRVLSDNFDVVNGICKDIFIKKSYSINFMWLRVDSYTEKCLSILGNEDDFFEINTLDKVLKFKENPFFNKLISWSKLNQNAIINFWIDSTQLRISTIINLRLVFDLINRAEKICLCVRDIWSLKIVEDLNKRYPNILPKCTGYSLIMRVDLYKCIINVEDLEKYTYSVFADIDMLPIDENEIFSQNNISILNEIGLILSKISYEFENGFQILGSTIEKTRKGVIDAFKIMMIERTMIICTKFIMDESKKNKSLDQLVYILYNSMYRFLYYKCGWGIYYFFYQDSYIKSREDNDDKLIESITSFTKTATYIQDNNKYGFYISYELLNVKKEMIDKIFVDSLSEKEIIVKIRENTSATNICKYYNSLRTLRTNSSKKYIVKWCKNIDTFNFNLNFLPVKEKHLILFEGSEILKMSEEKWPPHMC
jgi:hypothetical protein